jgi:hypothetical protein
MRVPGITCTVTGDSIATADMLGASIQALAPGGLVAIVAVTSEAAGRGGIEALGDGGEVAGAGMDSMRGELVR